ncbi:MAG: biotin/lipoate A/B protein ligase family protein [Promethearchaeota archaeon]
MDTWRYIPLDTRTGYWNMALDEAVLDSVISKQSPNTLRFFKWKPSTVTIGRNQSLSDEVHIDFAKEKGFNIVRRITGGGAVFHDKDREITYSIACPQSFLKKLKANNTMEQYELITQGIISGLHAYGLNAEKGVIHCPALFLDGKKISGNAQARKKGHLLQHGTILLDLDPELMYSVLKAPQGVSKSRMVKSVYAKCVGLKDYILEYEEKRIISSLKEGFENTLGICLKEGGFTEQELRTAEELVEKRYSNSEWLTKYG